MNADRIGHCLPFLQTFVLDCGGFEGQFSHDQLAQLTLNSCPSEAGDIVHLSMVPKLQSLDVICKAPGILVSNSSGSVDISIQKAHSLLGGHAKT